jgi:hypothetical protein
MKIIDIHVHLADPAWQSLDPLVAACDTAYRRLRRRLPAGIRATLEVAAGALAPAHRALRDRAIGLASRALASSRNRAIYLGAAGARLAERAGPLLAASFLRASPENLLAAMDDAGIAAAAVLPVAPHTTTELVLSLCRSARLIPFCSVAPGTADPGAALEAAKARGCRGVKVHPTLQDLRPDAPFYHDLADAAGALGLPVLGHTGTICYEGHPHGAWSGARAYEPLVRAHRRTCFILAHMNLFEPDEAIAVARANENVWLDTSWQPAGIVRRAARALGPARLIFGSDWPFLGCELGGAVAIVERALEGRADALERVLARNAEELLGLARSREPAATRSSAPPV